jgi:hypothetical protein
MQLDALLFKIAALCAFYYAAVQAAQWWLRSRIANLRKLDESIDVRNHPDNVLRMQLVLSSMFLMIIGFGGVALAIFAAAPALAVLGFVFSLLFLFIEICYRSIELFGVTRVLVPQYLGETDAASKAAKGAIIEVFNTSVIAVYFPLLVGIMAASILFGVATIDGGGLETLVGVVFFAHAIHALMRILEMHGGIKTLSSFNLRVYFPLAIGKYTLIGVWLWSL